MKNIHVFFIILCAISFQVRAQSSYGFEGKFTQVDTLYAMDTLFLNLSSPDYQRGLNYKANENGSYTLYVNEGYAARLGLEYSNCGTGGSRFEYGYKIGDGTPQRIEERIIRNSEFVDFTLNTSSLFAGENIDLSDGLRVYITCTRGKVAIRNRNLYLYRSFKSDFFGQYRGEEIITTDNLTIEKRLLSGIYDVTLPYALPKGYRVQVTPHGITPCMVSINAITPTAFEIRTWSLTGILVDREFDVELIPK